MSLDVYLKLEEVLSAKGGTGIFVRENGQTKEISREEWDEKFPGREPYTGSTPVLTEYIYSANITHNLGKMAAQANIYEAMWRPEEIEIDRASQLIPLLENGLAMLEASPSFYKQFNPSNGWGNYEGLIDFVHRYLEACRRYPNATVHVGR